MEGYEEDDDTHYCNKCHLTVTGLDNYVRHRQSGCRTTTENKSVYDCPPPSSVSYPECLNADDFFSSLELQSSTKPQPPRAADLLDVRPKQPCRPEERRKRPRRDIKSPDGMKNEPKDKIPHLLPAVDDIDDLASLVFPELGPAEATTSANPTQTMSPVPSTAVSMDKAVDDGRTGSSKTNVPHKQEAKHDDSSQGRRGEYPHSGWLEESVYSEEMHHLDRYAAESDYEQEDDMEDSTDQDVTLDDDSYSDSDDQDHVDHRYPPGTHTGGKWRPPGMVHEDMHDDELDTDVAEHHHDNHPHPSYTGGKWNPADSTAVRVFTKQDNSECSQTRRQLQQPPPDHTRGKWVPGARADVATGYWCSPCGRKLASQLVYKRHLASELHARRSIQEIDGLVPPRALSRRQRVLASKKTSTTSSLADSVSAPSSSSTVSEEQRHSSQNPRRRRREKEVLTCEMCRARVRRAQLGKHLLSHYHCRVAGAIAAATTTTTRSNEVDDNDTQREQQQHQRFLLENMANIVRQCPFQCAPCRFYCNTEDTFLRHWRSQDHRHVVSKIGGSFVCALCDFWCKDNESVEVHIMEQGHRDAVSMINGSVPMVIRRQRILACSACCKPFRYNVQLRVHARETGHEVDESASDEYQCIMKCSHCEHVARSKLALQRHQLNQHKTETLPNDLNPYFCSFCSTNFKTKRKAVGHRRTSSHKEKVKSSKKESCQRVCAHCKETLSNLAEFKRHMFDAHLELCHRCGKCGEKFAIPQDVTTHTRDNRCSRSNVTTADAAAAYACDKCCFNTESESEFMFHQVLHGNPVEIDSAPGAGRKTRDRPKYPCPLCQKLFSKFNLREHLRVHTGERPYSCAHCRATFVRRCDMAGHCNKCSDSAGVEATKDARERKYVCHECGDGFYTKHTLRQHILRHAGKQYKCGLPGCPIILRTANELRRHRELVHESTKEIRPFKCNDCTYAAKTNVQLARHRQIHDTPNEDNPDSHVCSFEGCNFKTNNGSHMKRHFRLHSGTKPYKCRYCTYASNNVENLRKHVLSTKIHVGKTIYQCESCRAGEAFGTNYSKELRAHLLESHPDEYPTPDAAKRYVDDIFQQSATL